MTQLIVSREYYFALVPYNLLGLSLCCATYQTHQPNIGLFCDLSFDVAKQLNMVPYNDHKDLVDEICKGLPQDYDWPDGEDALPVYQSFKKMGLVRYHLAFINLRVKRKIDERSEAMSSESSKKTKNDVVQAICGLLL